MTSPDNFDIFFLQKDTLKEMMKHPSQWKGKPTVKRDQDKPFLN